MDKPHGRKKLSRVQAGVYEGHLLVSVSSRKGRVALKTHSEGVFREAMDDSAEPVFRKLILKYNRNSQEHCANFLPSDAHPGRTEVAAGCEAEELGK